MEIKVDTKKDSCEDIKKAIEFLQQFIEKTSDAPLSTGAFNMFSDDAQPLSTTLNEKTEEKDEDEDININPAVEPY